MGIVTMEGVVRAERKRWRKESLRRKRIREC
jgi:hypothetical protein